MKRKLVMKCLVAIASVASGVAIACEYCNIIDQEGTLLDCSSSCVSYLYVPDKEECETTQDTVRCATSDSYDYVMYWAVGTCVGGQCIDIQRGQTTESGVLCVTDDGCTS